MHAEIRLCNLFGGALISCGIAFLHQYPVMKVCDHVQEAAPLFYLCSVLFVALVFWCRQNHLNNHFLITVFVQRSICLLSASRALPDFYFPVNLTLSGLRSFRLCEDLIWSLHPSPSSPSPHHGDSQITVTAVPPPAALLCDFMLRHKNLLQLSPCYSSVVLEALNCATFRTADQKSPCVFACMLNQNVILFYEYSSMSYTTSLSWAVFNWRLS